MRETLKRLTKLTAGYSLVTLIGPLFTILLTPLYTRVLTPADYGVVDVALTLGALISIFIMLGTDQAIAAHFFEGNESNRRNIVTSTWIYVAGAGLFAFMVLFALSESIAVILYKDPSRQVTIQLLALNVLFAPLYGLTSSALRLRMGIWRVNILGLTYLLTLVILNVLFVLVLQFKATGIIAANVLANTAGALMGLILIWKPLRGRLDANALKPVLKSGLALLPGLVGFIMLANIDRLMLTQYVSQEEIGIYSIANKLASMLYVALAAIWSAWWPIALEMSKSSDAPRQYARMFEYFLLASTLGALTLGLFAPEILRVFTGEQYWSAAPYATVLMIYSGPLTFMNGSFQISHYVGKRVGWISVAALASAGLNISLNVILDPYYGVWGAVTATIAAGVVFCLLTFVTGRGIMYVDYRWIRTSILFLSYLALVGAFGGFLGQMSVFIKVMAIMSLIVVFFVVGFLRISQINTGFRAMQRQIKTILC